MRYVLLFFLLFVASPLWADDGAIDGCISGAKCSHGISIWGDLKYGAGFTHFDYVNPDASKGGKIRYASIGTFDSVNSFILKGIKADGLSMTYETLLESSADEPFSEYGLLASRVILANDRSWVQFEINPEAKWHDGTPVTADDVVFSFNTLTKEGHPFYRTYYAEISAVEAVSNNMVKFTFSNTENRELPLIVGQLPIIPKAYYTKTDLKKSTLVPAMGSGPYKIDALEQGKWVRYKRAENYWGKDLPVNSGRHNYDIIQYDYYRDATVAIEAFKAGEYDFRQENISKVWAKSYEDFPARLDGRVIKEEIQHELPSGMQGFVFNTRRSKFSDRRVRKALAHAFDFEWSNKNLFYGAYRRTESFFENSAFASKGLPEEAELALLTKFKDKLPEDVFTTEYKSPRTDGKNSIRKNLLTADTLLKEAGWVVKDNKRVNADTGEHMKIEFLIVSPMFERVIAPFIRNLKRLGIEGKIRIVDSAQYVKRAEDFDFDVMVNVFAQSNSPGNEQINYWHSSKIDIPGSKNLAGINHPAVDFLVEKLVSAKSKDEQITAANAMDRVLLHEYYVIPHFHSRIFRVIYWDKFNRPEIRPKYSLGLDTWWLLKGATSQ